MTLTPSRYDIIKAGEKAPDFSLPATDGKTYSLKDFEGKKAVLIVFVANHCPYVQPKFPWLVELQKRYEGKGLQVVAISASDVSEFPDDSPEKMKEAVKEYGINFVYLYDETQEVAKAYGGACTPDPFLFDSEFRLVYHGRLDDAHKEPHETAKTNEMEEAIKQTLEGKKPDVQWLPSMGCNIKWKPGNEPSEQSEQR